MHRETGQPLDRPLYFKIKVKDVNDNAPEFPEEEFSISIRENHSEGKCHPNNGYYWFVYECFLNSFVLLLLTKSILLHRFYLVPKIMSTYFM